MASQANSKRSRLGIARGLGSAKDGTHHWMMQRVTAFALIPLTIWFVGSIMSVIGVHELMVLEFLSKPVNTMLMGLFIIFMLHHGQLGMQVVIEDYVHHEGAKIFALLMIKLITFFMGLIGVFAIIKLAVMGS